MPPAPKVVVPAKELSGFVTDLFVRAGVRPEHAATLTEVLIWASLRGVDSHGASRVPRYLEMFESGVANAAPDIRVVSEAAAVAVVDADRAPGPVALTVAADEAVRRARANGIGAAGVRGTVHTGAIGYYTSRIAESGLAGIGFVAGMPNMSYTGVKGAAVATSPLSVAVPAEGHAPALLDMATAQIALGKIAQYRNAGRTLPEGAAATADGVPTTDPNVAKIPLPLGGTKGAGMSLMFELITSVLLGAPILSSFHGDDPAGRKHRQNALLIALDPAAFGGDGFAAAAGTTLETLKGLTRADEDTEIVYPGERSAATAETRTTKGVPIAAKVWNELRTAADKLGATPPHPAN
ncbi:Ldh family oxidoreductase [Spirillospora sp. NPDC048819]|uniref:Ldh family oxidoreductase n=1 Tax=Spirillospora sp. NPDC048819 TaxID=3155268 RepID=UPI0033F22FB1